MPSERHFSYVTGPPGLPQRDIEPKEINLNLGTSPELGIDIARTINNSNATMTGIVTKSGAVYWSTVSQSHEEITLAAVAEGVSKSDVVAQIQATNTLGKYAALYVVTVNELYAKQIGAFFKNSIDPTRQSEILFAIDTGIDPQFTNIEQVRAAGVFYHTVSGGRFLSAFTPSQIK